MKAVKIIAVLSLLVIFPAISYLYLIKGYNFRLEALQQLEPKMDLKSSNFPPNSSSNSLLAHATILYNADIQNAEAMLEPIFEQFSHRDEFQMFGFTENVDKLQEVTKDLQWQLVSGKYPYDKELAIIDTSATIRNYYMLDSISFTSLGQHIPIIIPRLKEQDIVLKRENEK